MDPLDLLALIATLGVFIYLLRVLFHPEDCS